jgi:hypothetical protein
MFCILSTVNVNWFPTRQEYTFPLYQCACASPQQLAAV